MSRKGKGEPTGLNLWVLKRFFGGEDEKPNGAIDSTDAPHLRRCLEAMLFTIEGGRSGTLKLTDKGREAVKGVR